MAITAASIEANGWVLRVTHTAGLGAFASYTLDPNGSPRLTLASSAPGYVQSAGTAIAGTAARTLIATKPLRLPVQATAAGVRSAKTIDETDLGGGLTRVRIALSQHVYATDTGLTLTAAAGWRSGETAAGGIAVTNGSTVAAPLPIVRWADVPYQLQGGAFDLEVVVASHHPNGLAPVVGVRFTVTDGTTVKTFWSTTLATSTAYSAGGTGQPLRVFKATVDPTGLTQGLLRCDFEVYPWIGPVQKSDTAGTRSMTGFGTAGFGTSAFVPFVVAYNPGGAWIVPRYAYVDPAGATTAAAANVSPTAATAAATPLATINLAVESLRLWAAANPGSGGTVAAANGQAAITQSVDGCRIRLVAGATQGTGTTNVTSGVNTSASWLVIEGNPADSAPRTNCILRAPATANGLNRLSRIRVTGVSVEAQTNTVMAAAYAWLDGAELRGIAGQETATGTPFAASGALLYLTNAKWWKHGTSPVVSGSNQIPVLVRNVAVERSINAPVVLNCARLPSAVAGTAGLIGSTGTSPSTDAGASLERIAIGNDLRYLSSAPMGLGGSTLANASAPANLTLGKTYPVSSRYAALNNVGESYGATFPLWSGVGENSTVVASEFIIEGNTLTGDRTNSVYNDLNLATIAANDAEDVQCRVFRFANNVTMKCASKHDFFNDPAVTSQRIGVALSATRSRVYAVGAEIVIAGSPANVYRCTIAGTSAATGGPTGTGSAITDGTVTWAWFATETRQHGYRPQATGVWSSHYGVGYEGNIDMQPPPPEPASDPEFWFEFFGLGSNQLSADGVAVTSTPFTLDKSGTTNRLSFQPLPDGTGGGNYKPLAGGSGAYILGRARSASVDTDARGALRAVPFASGALEGTVPAALLPVSARQPTRAVSPAAGWTTTVPAARSVLASRTSAGGVGWTVQLAVAAGRSASRAAMTAIQWAASLSPAGARLPTGSATTTADWSVLVVGQSARLAFRASPTTAGWQTQLASGASRLVQRAAAGLVGWSTALAVARARSASATAPSATGWTTGLAVAATRSGIVTAAGTVAWNGALLPDGALLTTFGGVTAVTTVGPWLVVVGSGRIGIADRTLPMLLPGTITPPERTLIITGDFRTITID